VIVDIVINGQVEQAKVCYQPKSNETILKLPIQTILKYSGQKTISSQPSVGFTVELHRWQQILLIVYLMKLNNQ
jgi:hypothetical protein